MNLNDYANFVGKVKSNTYFTQNVSAKMLAAALAIAHDSGEYADVVKRNLFYGPQDRADRVRRLDILEEMSSSAPHEFEHLPDDKKDLVHGILGVIGEGAEFADALTKILTGQTVDVVNLKEEIGDELWYLQVLATALGITLDECFEANVAKLTKRYPNATFTTERAMHRDLEGERKVLERT